MNNADKPLASIHLRIYQCDFDFLKAHVRSGSFTSLLRQLVSNYVAAIKASASNPEAPQ